jgi:hypothetical protein
MDCIGLHHDVTYDLNLLLGIEKVWKELNNHTSSSSSSYIVHHTIYEDTIKRNGNPDYTLH